MKNNLLPGEKVPLRADEGWGKVLFPGPHPPSGSPPAPGIKGLFFGGWILRLRHSAPRRMTGGGGIQRRLKVFGLENPTQRKSVAISMDFLMMLCLFVRIVAMCIDCGLMILSVLVLDCCHVHRFWIDSCL